jgi:hypothetical protein
MNLDKEVDLYIKLRDWLEAEKIKFDERCSPAKLEMARIEGRISAFLKESGQKNGATASGRFHITHTHKVTVVDRAEFFRFVVGQGDRGLLDLKANANAVFDFARDNNGQFPPGLNPSTEERVHVTRYR